MPYPEERDNIWVNQIAWGFFDGAGDPAFTWSNAYADNGDDIGGIASGSVLLRTVAAVWLQMVIPVGSPVPYDIPALVWKMTLPTGEPAAATGEETASRPLLTGILYPGTAYLDRPDSPSDASWIIVPYVGAPGVVETSAKRTTAGQGFGDAMAAVALEYLRPPEVDIPTLTGGWKARMLWKNIEGSPD